MGSVSATSTVAAPRRLGDTGRLMSIRRDFAGGYGIKNDCYWVRTTGKLLANVSKAAINSACVDAL